MSSTERTVPMADNTIETDLLVVGAGPAGASLACFLARYGLDGIMISAAPGTANTPRAHINNLSALDALRDLGLQDECYRLGQPGRYIEHYRWCETMAGEEYARIYSWGNDPRRKGDYEAASPCPGLLDLPQTVVEPMLVKYATTYGFKMRFDTQFLSFSVDQTSKKIKSIVKDRLGGIEYRIISKYLFGADGSRSTIVEQLGLPLIALPGGGIAFNCLVRCDLSHLMESRTGNLHWNLRLLRDDPWIINVRMSKPWTEWVLGALPKLGADISTPWNEEQWIEAVRDLAGDPNLEVEILNLSKWQINEVYAEKYSDGNIFCLGDAVHRHPPTNGLGSNTCIGDAFNLAWKVNLVVKGIAAPSLLDTFSAERQPVGQEVVKVANDSLRKHIAIWQLLGLQPPGTTIEEKAAGIKALKENSEKGKETRKKFRALVDDVYHETAALGVEMGQKYFGSAIYDADEAESWRPPGREVIDPILYYEPCAYPGRRLPHLWLGTEVPSKMVSTHDLAGKGDFCLFIGVAGQKWRKAAASVSKELGLPIKVVGVGAQQEWVDVYFNWEEKMGIDEDGALLVRPDLFCGWRSERRFESEAECTVKLRRVVSSILGWITA